MTATSDHPQRRPQRTGNGNGKPRNGYQRAQQQQQQQSQPRRIHHDLDDIEVMTDDPAQLPQDVRAEEGLIDSVIQQPDILETFSFVKPLYFFRAQHQVIWQQMQNMHADGRLIDHITLLDTLRTAGKLADAGGELAIYSLGNRVTHSGFAKEYARIVCEKYLSRCSLRFTGALAPVSTRGDPGEIISSWALQFAEIQEIGSALGMNADGSRGDPRHRLLTLAEMRNKPRAEWIIPGVLHERKRSLIFGDSNCGKSFLAVDLGLAIATGRAWHGRPVQKPGAVVYVCAEGADDIINRVDVWLLHHGLDDAPNFWIVDDSPNLLELGDVSGVIRQINNTLDEPPALVIFDTLAASMPGGDEKDSLDMGIVIGAIHRVQHECGCGVMVVHHSGKDETKGPRGSSALRADVDVAMRVSMDDQTGIIAVNGDKWRSDDKKKLSFGFRLISKALDDHADLTSCILEESGKIFSHTPSAESPAPSHPTPSQPSHAPASGRMTAPDRLFALMQEIAKPLRDGEWARLFVERNMGSAKTYEAAIAELRKRHVILNVQGAWVAEGVL